MIRRLLRLLRLFRRDARAANAAAYRAARHRSDTRGMARFAAANRAIVNASLRGRE